MRKHEIVTGAVYLAKISNKLTNVRIDGEALYSSGWDATNLATGRKVKIKSAAKLRKRVDM